jgi:hypothetical protein
MYINNYELLLALIGGLLISLSTSLNLCLKGRITGMSGLISGFIKNEGTTWKVPVISGMCVTTCIVYLIN